MLLSHAYLIKMQKSRKKSKKIDKIAFLPHFKKLYTNENNEKQLNMGACDQKVCSPYIIEKESP